MGGLNHTCVGGGRKWLSNVPAVPAARVCRYSYHLHVKTKGVDAKKISGTLFLEPNIRLQDADNRQLYV